MISLHSSHCLILQMALKATFSFDKARDCVRVEKQLALNGVSWKTSIKRTKHRRKVVLQYVIKVVTDGT